MAHFGRLGHQAESPGLPRGPVSGLGHCKRHCGFCWCRLAAETSRAATWSGKQATEEGLGYHERSLLVQVSDKTFTKLQSGAASKLPQRVQNILWPTLGGLATGLIALAYPEVLYQGFGNVNAILEARGSDYAPAVLLQIVAAKVVTTSICQRSGLVGGIYAPSIFMGAPLRFLPEASLKSAATHFVLQS